jgi:hypothetical protein
MDHSEFAKYDVQKMGHNKHSVRLNLHEFAWSDKPTADMVLLCLLEVNNKNNNLECLYADRTH